MTRFWCDRCKDDFTPEVETASETPECVFCGHDDTRPFGTASLRQIVWTPPTSSPKGLISYEK